MNRWSDSEFGSIDSFGLIYESNIQYLCEQKHMFCFHTNYEEKTMFPNNKRSKIAPLPKDSPHKSPWETGNHPSRQNNWNTPQSWVGYWERISLGPWPPFNKRFNKTMPTCLVSIPTTSRYQPQFGKKHEMIWLITWQNTSLELCQPRAFPWHFHEHHAIMFRFLKIFLPLDTIRWFGSWSISEKVAGNAISCPPNGLEGSCASSI